MDAGRITVVGQERRQAERAELSCPAKLKTSYSVWHGTLTNLSVGGARFEAGNPPRKGSTVLVEWESYEMICEVMWVEDERCGVRFEKPIAEYAVHEIAERNVKAEPPANLGNIKPGRRRNALRCSYRADPR